MTWLERAAAVARWADARRKSHKVPLLLLAVAVFAVGGIFSLSNLDVAPGEIYVAPLFPALLLVLVSLLYGGVGLQLLARSAGKTMPLGRATVVGAYAYLAELLPLPGGAIVRASALMKAGTSLGRSSALVVLTAVLWVALAMTGAGIALLSTSPHFAWPLVVTGSTIAIAITAWLWWTAQGAIAIATVLHRLAGIALIAFRLQMAFAVLGVTISVIDTLPFVLALLVGSASSIFPAGLGVSEGLAALAATTSAYAPATAFLAVGIDRLLCLACCGLTALLAQLGSREHHQTPQPALDGDI